MLDALVFANKACAGDWAIIGGLRRRVGSPPSRSSAEFAKVLQCFGLETAVCQFLDPVGEPMFEEARL